jgi:hypothetical protein
MFSTLILYSQLSGNVWTTQSLEGVSAWLSPGYVHTDELSAQSGFNRLPDLIGAQASGKYTRFIENLEMIRCRAMAGRHWYGVVIGVNPPRQGKGIGGWLPARPSLGGSERRAHLETCQPKNLGFYSRHGSEVVAEGTEPESGLRYWCFRRRPQSSDGGANRIRVATSFRRKSG